MPSHDELDVGVRNRGTRRVGHSHRDLNYGAGRIRSWPNFVSGRGSLRGCGDRGRKGCNGSQPYRENRVQRARRSNLRFIHGHIAFSRFCSVFVELATGHCLAESARAATRSHPGKNTVFQWRPNPRRFTWLRDSSRFSSEPRRVRFCDGASHERTHSKNSVRTFRAGGSYYKQIAGDRFGPRLAKHRPGCSARPVLRTGSLQEYPARRLRKSNSGGCDGNVATGSAIPGSGCC